MLPLKMSRCLANAVHPAVIFSFYLLVLVFVSCAVSLSQVDVVFNILDLGGVDIYWCVVFRHHLCLRLVCHLQIMVFTFIS